MFPIFPSKTYFIDKVAVKLCCMRFFLIKVLAKAGRFLSFFINFVSEGSF